MQYFAQINNSILPFLRLFPTNVVDIKIINDNQTLNFAEKESIA